MIGVFGGTFDPIHFGHLRIALEMAEFLRLSQVNFVPCRQPPHRDEPCAGSQHRLAMLRLAIHGQSNFVIDERELSRSGPSYMVDTLRSLRDELPDDQPLCLMLGMDAFNLISSWHQWRDLIKLAHIALAVRPGSSSVSEGDVRRLYEDCLTTDVSLLSQQPAGCIVECSVTQMDISATLIRRRCADSCDLRYLLPDDVVSYIKDQQLYSV